MLKNRPTILIVDDDPDARIAFAAALEDDYNLIEAETGEEALRILQERKDIDLVLLDYSLPPGMDGLEVLTRMRALNYKIPVILVTGRGSEEVAVEALRLGVTNYIIKTKPFKVKELQTIVKETLAPVNLDTFLVDRAVDFMERQYCRPISARDVAQGIGVSYPHLARLFKANKGCSVEVWLNRLRINKAKTLLEDSTLEIKQVATEVGVNDQNYFYQLFRKITGKSPSEYRKDHKKGNL